MLNGIGITRFASGEFEEALTEFEDSLALWQDLEDSSGVTGALNNIGTTYFALNELDNALDAFEEALELHSAHLVESFGPRSSYKQTSHELKDALKGVSDTLYHIAYVYDAKRSTTAAKFYLEEALRIQKTLDHAKEVKHITDILSLCKSASDTLEL